MPPAARAKACAAPKLIAHDIAERLVAEIDAAAAEALQIGKAGMRADADIARHGPRHGARHHIRIARVKPAGDIGGADDLQQRGIVAHGPGAEAFAHVGIEIDGFLHGSRLLIDGRR